MKLQGQDLKTPLLVVRNENLTTGNLGANNNQIEDQKTNSAFINEKEQTNNLEENFESIHQKNQIEQNLTDKVNAKKQIKNLQDLFNNGPKPFQIFRNHFVTVLNIVGISLNSLAVVGPTLLPKAVADYTDKAAEWYSRYVVSLGFGWNGIESLVGKRPIEALSRFLPTIGFFFLPFYNFNLSTGISSTMSYIFDKITSRNGDKQPGPGSAIENTKGVLKHGLDIFKEFFSNKSQESIIERVGIAGLGIGTLGGLIFAHHERDNIAARLFGNIRNIGGLVADWELVFNDDKTWRGNHKKLVGLTCSTASILNIIARWVNPELGRVLNHLSIAADDFGLTYWAQMSKKDNDEAAGITNKKIVELSKPIEQDYNQNALASMTNAFLAA